MNTDHESIENYLLTLKPSKLPTTAKQTILSELDALKQEAYRPRATYSYWFSLWAVAASLLLLLTGIGLLSGIYTGEKIRTPSRGGYGMSLSLISSDTNLETRFFAGMDHSTHNNVANIDFPHFYTNSTVQML